MLLQILSDADPKNVWKVGYYIEKGEYNYSHAVIHAFLSILSVSSVDELNGLPNPDYTILPKHYDEVLYYLEEDELGEVVNCVTECPYGSSSKVGSYECKTNCTNFVRVYEKGSWVVCKGVMVNETN